MHTENGTLMFINGFHVRRPKVQMSDGSLGRRPTFQKTRGPSDKWSSLHMNSHRSTYELLVGRYHKGPVSLPIHRMARSRGPRARGLHHQATSPCAPGDGRMWWQSTHSLQVRRLYYYHTYWSHQA